MAEPVGAPDESTGPHDVRPESGPPLVVLLLGPVVGRDAESGDTAYTSALLADPPPGVEYVDYPTALADGRVVIRGRRARHGGRTSTDRALLVLRSAEKAVRSKLMFREPTWFVSLEPGAFDLVHAHLFPVRQVGGSVPVVSSAGYPLTELYAAREGWSGRRVRVALQLERLWSRSVGNHDPWLRCGRGNVMTVYTDHFRDLLVRRGVEPSRVRVASTALPPSVAPLIERPDPPTVGFIGRDFHRKGGPAALRAFARLARDHPDWRFVVVGRVPPEFEDRSGEVLGELPRDRLLADVLPRLDVLVLPTNLDCGAPYGVLEALQAGAGVVLGRSPWLDDRLAAPAVELIDHDDPATIAEAVERSRAVPRADRAAAARQLWEESFSMPVLHAALLAAYRLMLAP